MLRTFFLSFVNERKPACGSRNTSHTGGFPTRPQPGPRTGFDSGLECDCGKRTITPEAELIFKSGGFSQGRREEGVPTGQAETGAPGPPCGRQSFRKPRPLGGFTRRAMKKPQEQHEPLQPHQNPRVNIGTHPGHLKHTHTHTHTHAESFTKWRTAELSAEPEKDPGGGGQRGTARPGLGTKRASSQSMEEEGGQSVREHRGCRLNNHWVDQGL